jgi:hypothetical protein
MTMMATTPTAGHVALQRQGTSLFPQPIPDLSLGRQFVSDLSSRRALSGSGGASFFLVSLPPASGFRRNCVEEGPLSGPREADGVESTDLSLAE